MPAFSSAEAWRYSFKVISCISLSSARVAAATSAARWSESTPSASHRRPTVFRRGILRRPAFNAATPAALIPERSASRSCVRSADVRNRLRAAPNEQRRASPSTMMAPVPRFPASAVSSCGILAAATSQCNAVDAPVGIDWAADRHQCRLSRARGANVRRRRCRRAEPRAQLLLAAELARRRQNGLVLLGPWSPSSVRSAPKGEAPETDRPDQCCP